MRSRVEGEKVWSITIHCICTANTTDELYSRDLDQVEHHEFSKCSYILRINIIKSIIGIAKCS